MNKQLSVMGLAARASMVPVLIAAGLRHWRWVR